MTATAVIQRIGYGAVTARRGYARVSLARLSDCIGGGVVSLVALQTTALNGRMIGGRRSRARSSRNNRAAQSLSSSGGQVSRRGGFRGKSGRGDIRARYAAVALAVRKMRWSDEIAVERAAVREVCRNYDLFLAIGADGMVSIRRRGRLDLGWWLGRKAMQARAATTWFWSRAAERLKKATPVGGQRRKPKRKTTEQLRECTVSCIMTGERAVTVRCGRAFGDGVWHERCCQVVGVVLQKGGMDGRMEGRRRGPRFSSGDIRAIGYRPHSVVPPPYPLWLAGGHKYI
jgi:hypothetical protein